MHKTTSVRVSIGTRDDLRRLAAADGLTLDEEIRRLVRAERQRRIGDALASAEPDAEDDAWLNLGAKTVGEHAGG